MTFCPRYLHVYTTLRTCERQLDKKKASSSNKERSVINLAEVNSPVWIIKPCGQYCSGHNFERKTNDIDFCHLRSKMELVWKLASREELQD